MPASEHRKHHNTGGPTDGASPHCCAEPDHPSSADRVWADRKTKRGPAIKGLESAHEGSLAVRRRRSDGRFDGFSLSRSIRQV